MLASSVEVAYANTGKPERVRELTLVQEEYRHDIAIFSAATMRPNSFMHPAGTPVRISWGVGRDAASFVGYVHHIEPGTGVGGAPKVWCKSASTAFENGVQTTWRYRTVPSVVSELARQLQFDAEVVSHGKVFDSIVAPGGRLWDVLVEYAKEIGYSLYCNGTRMSCHPRTHKVEQLLTQAPVLRADDVDGMLLDFKPIDGAAPPGEHRAHRVITGIDRRTGGRFQVVGGAASGRLGRHMIGSSGVRHIQTDVGTPEEARWKLAALAEMARFNVRATAKADGHPRVTQTSPVVLAGVGDTYEGAWFVHKVQHNITESYYTMDLELGRDALGSNSAVPDARARRVVQTRNNPQGRPKAVYPPSILVGGQWRSQWSAASRTFR